MKITALIISILLSMSSFGQLKEFDIKETAPQPNPPVFVNNPNDAAIIIYSSISDLDFESNVDGIIKKITDVNKYTLIIATERQYIKVKNRAFREDRISVPKLEPRAVRYFTIEAKAASVSARADDNLYDVIFNLNEDSVYASYGSFTPTLNKDKLISFRLPKGDYTFKFAKYGFNDVSAAVSVTGSVQKEVTLTAGQSSKGKRLELDGIVFITSEPPGAEVLINGQKQGNTPFQTTIAIGTYQLEVRKNLYYTEISTFTLVEGKTVTLKPVLKPKFGYISVTSSQPNSTILIDGKPLGAGPVIKRETESAEHTVRVTADLYHDYTETFTLIDGMEKNIKAELKPAFGYLELNTTPEQDAAVYIDGQRVGVTPYKSDRMRSGQYTLKITKPLYADLEESIIIQDNKTESRILALNKNFGNLSVTAEGCDIYLNGSKVGSGIFASRLSPGNYKVRAERGAKYYAEEKDVYLMIGDKKVISFSLEPKMGQVSVLIEPIEAADADIYIDDERKGSAPLIFPLIIGDYTLKAKKANYLDVTQTITVSENQKQSVKLSMLTYEGSRKQIRDKWALWKWIGLGSGAAAAGISGYFYLSAQKQYDNYKTTQSSADAANYRKLTTDHQKFSGYAIAAAGTFVLGALISWIGEAVNN